MTMIRLMQLCLFSMAIHGASALAGVYKCPAADGKSVFQDHPCASGDARPAGDKPLSSPAKAALVVLATAARVEQMQRWCAREDYPSAVTISKARGEWTIRHAAFLDASSRLLQTLPASQRKAVQAEAKSQGESSVHKLADAPKDERLIWCRAAAARIGSPEMDLTLQPKLLEALNGAP